MPHVMLDLEVGSTLPDGAIMQISAVSFTTNPNTVCAPARAFNVYCFDWAFAGGSVDKDTMAWWRAQERYPEMLRQLRVTDYSEANALDAFAEWLVDECKGHELEGLWGYPSTSDLMWLECAYRRHGYKDLPWKYYHARDLHTLEKALGVPEVGPFQGEEHDAFADCVHQVKKVWALLGKAPVDLKAG